MRETWKSGKLSKLSWKYSKTGTQKDMYEDRIMDLENQVEDIEYEKTVLNTTSVNSQWKRENVRDAVIFYDIWEKSIIEGAVLLIKISAAEDIVKNCPNRAPVSSPKEFVDLYTVFSSIFAAHMKVIRCCKSSWIIFPKHLSGVWGCLQA